MATNYPTGLDTGANLPNPSAGDTLAAVDHADQHGTVNNAVKSLEAKVGTGVSTPQLNYLLTGTATGSSWQPAPVSAVWGLITGTLSNQTDLSNSLNTLTTASTTTNTRIDNLSSTTLVRNQIPSGAINGSNTAYTTASTFNTGSLKVYLNGQTLTPGAANDYVEGTSSFTMQYAPATGDVLVVDYNTSNGVFVQGSNSIIVQETPTGTVNGATVLFTTLQSKYVANSLEVFINGLQQTKTTDYTETSPGNGTFTFATAPLTGDVVKVSYQFSTGASGNADTVDGFHASSTATANNLLPLNANSKYPASALDLTAYSGTIAQVSALSSTLQNSATTVTVVTAGTYLIIVNGEFNGNNTNGDKGLTVSFTNGVASIQNYFTTIAGMYFVQVPINRIITVPANTVVSFGGTDSGVAGTALLGSRSAYSIMRVG